MTPCARPLQAEFLRSVFDQYGSVQFVKYLREKGGCACPRAAPRACQPPGRRHRGPRGPSSRSGGGLGRIAHGAHLTCACLAGGQAALEGHAQACGALGCPMGRRAARGEAQLPVLSGREVGCGCAAGVAYVKYDRASSCALAIENLHEVTLNDGQGPRLKVILADSPHTRCLGRGWPARRSSDQPMAATNGGQRRALGWAGQARMPATGVLWARPWACQAPWRADRPPFAAPGP